MEQQAQQEPKVKLEITIKELNAVLLGLTKVELGSSISAWQSIHMQAEKQLGSPSQGAASGELAGKVIQ